MITNIYLIKTQNSIYEVQVSEKDTSRCRKVDGDWYAVKGDNPEYLEKLVIGASFDVPGVVLTSVVKDYQHFVPSGEPKRTTTEGFFGGLTEAIIGQVRGRQAVVVRGENDEDSYS